MSSKNQNKIWIVNDILTSIPNVKTFWHELLDLSNKCINKCPKNGSYFLLNWKISLSLFFLKEKPAYIVRNATFMKNFPWHPKQTKIISLLQDWYSENYFKKYQLKVIKKSNIVVCVSPWIRDKVLELTPIKHKGKIVLINNGVDENMFNINSKIIENKKLLPHKGGLCFIGADVDSKDFPFLLKIIEKTNYKFNLIMKDDFKLSHERVRVFNKVDRNDWKYIVANSSAGICTSKNSETFHLSGIEMMLMNKPLITTKCGIYISLEEKGFENNIINQPSKASGGVFINKENYLEKIKLLFENYDLFKPREFCIENKLAKTENNNAWKNILGLE